MKKLALGTIALVLSVFQAYADNPNFSFLNLPSHAKTAALGGQGVSYNGDHIFDFTNNPAALSNNNAGVIGLSHFWYYADAGYSSLAYAHNFDKLGTVGLDVRFLNYGAFQAYEADGTPSGEYRANDHLIGLTHSRKAGNFKLGVQLQYVGSQIETVKSSRLLVGIGGQFIHPERDLTVGLLIKNLGVTLSNYPGATKTSSPVDAQLGATFKPEHMPVRFTLTAYNLVPNGESPVRDSTVNNISRYLGQAFERTAIGMEILISENVQLRTGYNHRISQDLRLEQGRIFTGFSFGFRVKINAFDLSYSLASYHAAGAANFITLGINTDRLFNKTINL